MRKLQRKKGGSLPFRPYEGHFKGICSTDGHGDFGRRQPDSPALQDLSILKATAKARSLTTYTRNIGMHSAAKKSS